MYRAYHAVEIPGTDGKVGTGWLPPLPDLRDYSASDPKIGPMARKLGLAVDAKAPPSLPGAVDLRN